MSDATFYDNPNQQVVRPDGSSVVADPGDVMLEPHAPAAATTVDLDAMTKDQLLAYAEQLGLSVDSSMLKSEVRAAIDAHLAGA